MLSRRLLFVIATGILVIVVIALLTGVSIVRFGWSLPVFPFALTVPTALPTEEATATPTPESIVGETASPTATPTEIPSPTPAPPSPTALPTLTATPPSPTPTPLVIDIRLNAGGDAISVGDMAWAADQPYTPGGWGYLAGRDTFTAFSSWPFAGLTTAVYQSQRARVNGYRFDLPPGSYVVTLKFAELYLDTDPGDRVFDVWVQGQAVATPLDIVAEVGRLHPLDLVVTTTVGAEGLTVSLVPRRGETVINGLWVRSVGPMTAPISTIPATRPPSTPGAIPPSPTGTASVLPPTATPTGVVPVPTSTPTGAAVVPTPTVGVQVTPTLRPATPTTPVTSPTPSPIATPSPAITPTPTMTLPPATDAGSGWLAYSEADVRILFRPGDEAGARDILHTLVEARPRLSADLGLALAPMEVRLFPDRSAYNEAVGRTVPADQVGNLIDANHMYLIAPTHAATAEKTSILKGSIVEQVRALLLAVSPMAQWLNDGLASYEAGLWNEERTAYMRSLMRLRRIVSLQALDSDAYNYMGGSVTAHTVIDYIVRRYGLSTLKTIVANARGQSGVVAVSRGTGAPLADIEAGWLADLRQRFGP